jgi:hypothetical protein
MITFAEHIDLNMVYVILLHCVMMDYEWSGTSTESGVGKQSVQTWVLWFKNI